MIYFGYGRAHSHLRQGGHIRQILKNPESHARVAAALMIDGVHTD